MSHGGHQGGAVLLAVREPRSVLPSTAMSRRPPPGLGVPGGSVRQPGPGRRRPRRPGQGRSSWHGRTDQTGQRIGPEPEQGQDTLRRVVTHSPIAVIDAAPNRTAAAAAASRAVHGWRMPRRARGPNPSTRYFRRSVLVSSRAGPEGPPNVAGMGPRRWRSLISKPQADPGQVRIRVHTAAVNPTDTLVRSGRVRGDGPLMPGMDGAGMIDQLGRETDGRLFVGRRVVALVLPQVSQGACAERIVVPAASVVSAPENTGFPKASTVLINAIPPGSPSTNWPSPPATHSR